MVGLTREPISDVPVEACEANILGAIGSEMTLLYRRRLLEYTPLSIQNCRSIEPVRKLDAPDQHVVGSLTQGRSHHFAVATHVLAAAGPIEAAKSTR